MATILPRPYHRKKDTPETEFRKACILWLMVTFRGHIWHHRTLAGLGRKLGVLDDHFIICGTPVQAEWKRPDGKWSKTTKTYFAQKAEIEAVISAGGRAAFVDSWEALEALVEGIPRVQIMIQRTQVSSQSIKIQKT